MTDIKTFDFKTGQPVILPNREGVSWLTWLEHNGYAELQRMQFEDVLFRLFRHDTKGLYAVYHPEFMDSGTECLYVNIDSLKGAVDLIGTAIQTLEPIKAIKTMRKKLGFS